MRDVAVVSFAHSAVAKDAEHNEVEIVVPGRARGDRAARASRSDATSASRARAASTTSQGGPFTFVHGPRRASARGRRCRESHVEMDAAWALYEAWVAIQTGEVDSALIYGFGKSSLGDLHEIMTLQTDPYYVAPLWPSMVDMAALQARAYLDARGRDRARPRRGRGAQSQRNAQRNPHAVSHGRRRRADDAARAAGDAPTRCATPTSRPITDGAAAIVIAAGDLARQSASGRRGSAASSTASRRTRLGVRDLTTAPSATLAAAEGRRGRRRDRRRRAARAVQPRGADPRARRSGSTTAIGRQPVGRSARRRTR